MAERKKLLCRLGIHLRYNVVFGPIGTVMYYCKYCGTPNCSDEGVARFEAEVALAEQYREMGYREDEVQNFILGRSNTDRIWPFFVPSVR